MNLSRRFFVAAVAVLFACSGAVSASGNAKPLVVGMELAYPPFEMTDPSGKPTGVSVDLATDLGDAVAPEVDGVGIAAELQLAVVAVEHPAVSA